MLGEASEMSNVWVAIVIALLSPVALHFIAEGYRRRQLEDIEKSVAGKADKTTVAELEKRVEKGFEYDKSHFAHAAQTDIHQRSMDEKLIEARFETVNVQVAAL